MGDVDVPADEVRDAGHVAVMRGDDPSERHLVASGRGLDDTRGLGLHRTAHADTDAPASPSVAIIR
jgi:hypothetical protein